MAGLKYMKSFKVENFVDAGINFYDTFDEALDYASRNDKLLIIYFCDESQRGEGDKFINILLNKDCNSLFQKYICTFVTDISNDYYIDEFKAYMLSLENDLQEDLKNRLFMFSLKDQSLECLVKMNTEETSESEILYQLYLAVEEYEEFLLKQIDNLVEECASLYVCSDEWYDISKIYNYIPINQAIKICMNQPLPHLRKVLVLYMYKEDSVLTCKFNELLQNGIFKQYNQLLLPIFWDITDPVYHNALKSVCDRYFDEDILKNTITSEEGGIFFFLPDENNMNATPKIFSTVLYSDWQLDNITETIEHMFTYFQEANNITDLHEFKAIKSARNAGHIIRFFMRENLGCSLHDATEMCLQFPQKMLLLHFNTTSPILRQKMFKLSDIFFPERAMLLSWNVENTSINEKLKIALDRTFGLAKLEEILQAKCPALFIFVPVGKTMILYSVIEENTSDSSMIQIYKEANKFFYHETELAAKFDEDCGPVAYQQIMYKQMGDRDFDCFKLDKEQGDQLEEKIGFAYYGPPLSETGYSDSQKKEIKTAFNKITNVASKYGENSTTLYISFMRICITPLPAEKHERLLRDNEYEPCLDFGIVPLFGIRKCFDCPKNSSECRIYIDHTGRIYEGGWEDFLENNKFPKMMLIAPKNGKYTGDYRDCVQLEICPSPACGIGPAILKGFDIGASIVGGVAGITGLVAAFFAVPVLPMAAMGVGIGVGVYSIVRSGMVLADRGRYGESMSFSSAEARGAYLNILAGSLGFTGASATFALSYMARTGVTIGMTSRVIVNGITIANLTANGAAITNSAYDVISQWTEDGSPNSLALLQLTSSVLFFGHAVYSAQSASTIIDNSQTSTINEILESLTSNRRRKTVMNLLNQTAQESGNVQVANAQVIKYLRNLDNIQDVVATLTRNTKLMSKNGIKYSVKVDKLVFNGVEVDIHDFTSLSKIARSEMLSSLPAVEQRPKSPVRATNSNVMKINKIQMADTIGNCVKIALNPSLNLIGKMQQLLTQFTPYIQDLLVNILQKFLHTMEIDSKILFQSLQNLYPNQMIPNVMNMIIKFYFADGIQAFIPEYVKPTVNTIMHLVEKAIIYSRYSMVTLIQKLIVFCSKWVIQEIYDRGNDTLNTEIVTQRTVNACAKCKGKYYA